MVRCCSICKKLDYKYPHLTFYSFPKNEVLKKMWLNSLGMTKASSLLPKFKEICSDHLCNEDFDTSFGKKRLKKGALPMPCVLQENEQNPEMVCPPKESQSFDATFLQETIYTEPVAKRLKMSVLTGTSGDPDKENLPLLQSAVHDNLNVTLSTSDSGTVTASPTSSTSTASVCEDMTVAKDSSVSERLQSKLSSSPSNLATVNVSPGSTTATASEGPEEAPEITELEIGSHDSETSTTATASDTVEILLKAAEDGLEDITAISERSAFRGKLALLDPKGTRQAKSKRQVKTQKNKIKSLQQSVRRLRKKANNLQSVIDVLKKKALITENAEAAMKEVNL
nr:unnamed protein product [Callosobruchus analis]